MSEALISQREFARRLEVSEKTIRDGIKTGKISKGVIYENGKPKINFAIALEESQSIGLGLKVKKQASNQDNNVPAKQDPKSQTKEKSVFNNKLLDEVGVLPYAEALRVKENHNAKLKEIEVKRLEEILVEKDAVYKQLFEFGKEIKNEFESLPGRTAPKLIGIMDLTKITEILAIEIRNSLNKLVENLSEKKVC